MDIKFKAVRLDCMEVGDVLLVDFESKNGGYANIRFFTSDKKHFYETTYNLNDKDIKLLRYIGVKDKNGIEIYDGHVVKHKYRFGNGIGIVQDTAPKTTLKHPVKNEICDEFEWYEWEEFKVIGNIYENQELLIESK